MRVHRSTLHALPVAAGLVLGPLSLLLPATGVLAADTSVPASALRVVRGGASEQGIAALAEASQSGTSDDWADYLELSPARNGLVARIDFELPVDDVVAGLESIALEMNWRGPNADEQRWRWHARDRARGRWVAVGDNAALPDWRWEAQRIDLPGDPARWLDAAGRVSMRLSTRTDVDVIDIDHLALQAVRRPPVGPPVTPPVAAGEIWRPVPGTSWQWQLTGAIDESVDVAMYDIDLFDVPASTIDSLHAAGRVVICYFSAGSSEAWRDDAARFPASVKGRGNGWSGERWLDVRAIDALAPIMRARLDLAVAKGCDGVEPDNVDGYANATGFPLTGGDQLAYNRWLADEAHARALSIGLKNDLDQVVALEPWFDWALNEQCVQYDECETLLPFVQAGKAVFGVEYRGSPGAFCSVANALDFDWLDKDLDLGGRREACR